MVKTTQKKLKQFSRNFMCILPDIRTPQFIHVQFFVCKYEVRETLKTLKFKLWWQNLTSTDIKLFTLWSLTQ